MDGISLVREALQLAPSMKAIVLSMYEDRAHVEAAFAAGAAAYVLKSANPDDLRSAIRQAFEPSALPGKRLHERRARAGGKGTGRRRPHPQGSSRSFSSSQRAIPTLELAKMLWVTEQTVKFHLSNIYRKFGVANRTEASRWAQLNGLLTTDQLV